MKILKKIVYHFSLLIFKIDRSLKLNDIFHSLKMLGLLYIKNILSNKKNKFNKKILLNENLVDKER